MITIFVLILRLIHYLIWSKIKYFIKILPIFITLYVFTFLLAYYL